MSRPRFFDLRQKSLLRGSVLVLASLLASFLWTGYPEAHPNPILAIPALVAALGTLETLRCLRLKWSFYHGGVMLLLYMDIMAIAMILFLLLYPYDSSLL
jgi:hypothetical protein